MFLRNNTLRIVNSSRTDEGSYVCRADNQFGSAEMTAVLWVKGKWCPGGTLFSARLAQVRHQETDPNVTPPFLCTGAKKFIVLIHPWSKGSHTEESYYTRTHTAAHIQVSQPHTHTKPHLDFLVIVLGLLHFHVAHDKSGFAWGDSAAALCLQTPCVWSSARTGWRWP